MVRHLRSWRDALQISLDSVSAVLFPASCCVCSDPLLRLTRAPVCDACWQALAPQGGAVCWYCSEDLHISAFTPTGGSRQRACDQLCQPCRLARPPFVRAVAYGGYSGVLRCLIHALKYDGVLPIAERLGDHLAEAICRLGEEPGQAFGSGTDPVLVVSVPLHPAKQKQRGFNHAELLARSAVKAMQVRRPEWKLSLTVGLLERKRETKSQAGLSPHQRRANLRGVFFVPHAERVAGREVLLVDDIYTTGATARACSRALLRAGAAAVLVATVARPQRENAGMAEVSGNELPMQEDVAFWNTPAPQAVIAANQAQITTWGRHVFGQSHEQVNDSRS